MSSPQLEVHPGLPVVHAPRLEDPPDHGFFVELQVEDEVRRDREHVEVPDPLAIHPANARTGHRGVNVAVGEHDEPGLERGMML